MSGKRSEATAMPRTVERIPRVSKARFERDHLYRHAPVIIEGLFAGQPIASLNTLEKALRVIGDEEHAVAEELSASFLRSLRGAPRDAPESRSTIVRVREYVRRYRGTAMVAFAEGISSGLFELLTPPDYLDILGDPASPTVTSVYLANEGNHTHLHWDQHAYNNILYQVFGRKRAILFPESASNKLAPFGLQSRVFLENMAASERGRFIEFAGGAECELEPGDTLFMPAGMWHYFDYLETALSLSFRFARSHHNTSLIDAMGYCHGTPEFQHMAAGLVDDRRVAPPFAAAFREIERACSGTFASASEKFWTLQRLLEKLCDELCPEKQALVFWTSGFEELIERASTSSFPGTRARYRGLVERYSAEGKIAEALGCCKRALRLDPGDAALAAAHERLSGLHPGVTPAGAPPISYLGRGRSPRGRTRVRRART